MTATTTGPEGLNRGLTRRALLARSTALGAAFVAGPGFLAGRDAAWATEMNGSRTRTTSPP